jgi:hypothetical protein
MRAKMRVDGQPEMLPQNHWGSFSRYTKIIYKCSNQTKEETKQN